MPQLVDTNIAQYYMQKNNLLQHKILQEPLSTEEYAVIVKKR